VKTLFRLLAAVPLFLLHSLGSALGWMAFLASPTYRRRFLANGAQAGLRLRDVRAAVAAAGELVAELPRLWFGRPVPIQWEGDALIDQARSEGRGIVFLTPHLGCFEATAQAYARRYGQITVLYRPATAPTTLAGVKQMLKALKAGEAVGLLPDQVPPAGLGEWAPFFGRSAYTMTLPARLAQQTGALILLAWGERLAWGRGYRIHLRPAPATLPTDPAAAAAAVNALMEALIRECPAQYLWGYARYKSPGAAR
jgi:KDO2-lipid IV(A) lauroyltransferase